MKIAFSGPGASGKTVLAEQTSKLVKLPMIGSATRGMLRIMQIKSLVDLNPRDRAVLQYRALASHILEEIWMPEGFVADRTVWDFLCYFESLFKDDPQGQLGYKSLPWNMGAGSYDVVFYVEPHGKPVEWDGVRYTDEMKWVEEYVTATLPNKLMDLHKSGSIKKLVYLSATDDREKRIQQELGI